MFTKSKLSLIFSLFVVLSLSQNSFAQTTQTIRGKVIANENEKPLVGAAISINNQNKNAQTNENGEFRLEKVQTGRIQLNVSFVGFETQNITELLLESGKELVIEIRLNEASKQLSDAVVKAASPNLSGALTSINNITVEQVMRYPATFFDPARLATSFAGVVNDNDQANGMVIRGNSPNSMQWRLEGVEIVNPNHLSNAGTFSDRPTQNAGGTNILSAQLLGNMNFLTGAFPAEYGNALSGVMDMRLRKGNNENHEFTAQASVIGVDVAAEGPFSKKSKASYLVNYRYSFTGLLGLMGVKFGDEDIKFQDLSFNLSFPTKKVGDFTIFGMGGVSDNTFLAKEDKTLWTSEKDQFNISYSNMMAAFGVTHQVNLGEKILWKTVIASSSVQTNRSQSSVETIHIIKNKESFTSSILYKINSRNSLKTGIFLTKQYDSLGLDNSDRLGLDNSFKSSRGVIFQPFINFQSNISENLMLNAGLHYLSYTYNKTNSIEPRISFDYKLNPKNHLSFAYGLHSQLQLPQTYFSVSSLTDFDLNFNKAHHFVLSNRQQLKNNSYIKTELYYQKIFNVPVSTRNKSYSVLNATEYFNEFNLNSRGTGENYGIEITYQQYLEKGFYTLINGTLYNSTYKGSDLVKRNTRFNGRHIFNLTIGKEFTKSKNRIYGLNARIVWLGGFYETPINEAQSQIQGKTVYDTEKAFTIKQKDFFRPDLRVYFKKSKSKYSRTWSVDIQNVANYQNVGFSYYDTFLKKIVVKNQLGMIPILSYRWEF